MVSMISGFLARPMIKLLCVWAALDLCLAGSGIVVVISAIWFHRPNQLIINLILDDFHFFCGLGLGSGYLFTALASIAAVALGKDRLWGLKALNWLVIVLICGTLAFASWIWFFSLRQLQELCDIWLAQPADIQQAIQDKWECCGYWNGTSAGDFVTASGYCADRDFAADQPGCMSIITSASSPGTDHTLNNIFTCLYGWTAILGAFFLATLCVIKEVSLVIETRRTVVGSVIDVVKRQVEARFERIDEKRGGGGFV